MQSVGATGTVAECALAVTLSLSSVCMGSGWMSTVVVLDERVSSCFFSS